MAKRRMAYMLLRHPDGVWRPTVSPWEPDADEVEAMPASTERVAFDGVEIQMTVYGVCEGADLAFATFEDDAD